MVIFVFGEDDQSWGLANHVFWSFNNLEGCLESDFEDGTVQENTCRWVSRGPDGLCCFLRLANDIWTVFRSNNDADFIADLDGTSEDTDHSTSHVSHCTFSPQGGWFVRYSDGTVKISKNNAFPESFHRLVKDNGQAMRTKGTGSTKRQRCNISNVWFGCGETILMQFTDGTVASKDIPKSLLDHIVQKHEQGYRLTEFTSLCHYNSSYYFAEWAQHDNHKKLYAWNISTTGELTDKYIQEVVDGKNPQSPLRKASSTGAAYPSGSTKSHRTTSIQLFRSNSKGKNSLTGLQVAKLMKKAGLSDDDVLKIWELADEDGNGQFDQEEFVFAMELVRRCLGGYALPGKAHSTPVKVEGYWPKYRGTDMPLWCAQCKQAIFGKCKHCLICNGGNFDLCRRCGDSGTKCHGKHEMRWLMQVNTQQFLGSEDSFQCNACGLDLVGVFFVCKYCNGGEWRGCEECITGDRICAQNHTLYRFWKLDPASISKQQKDEKLNNGGNLAGLSAGIGSLNLTPDAPDDIRPSAHVEASVQQQKTDEDPHSMQAENSQLKESLKASILTEKPNVHWEDVAGLESAKEELQEAVILPIKFPQLYSGKRKARRGMLLYGPPGTGKSYLAKAVATEVDSTLFSISSADVMSKWYGESERLIQALFALARERKPSVIFIDEIDALCGNRDSADTSEHTARMKTEILIQMDGVGKDNTGVLVLAATNLPWVLDPALRRRLQKRIYIPLPNTSARARMFELAVNDVRSNISDKDFQAFAEQSDGLSGSDISNAVQDALMQPVKKVLTTKHWKLIQVDGIDKYTPCDFSEDGAIPMTWRNVSTSQLYEPEVTVQDFYDVLGKTKASVGTDELGKYAEWTERFGSEGV